MEALIITMIAKMSQHFISTSFFTPVSYFRREQETGREKMCKCSGLEEDSCFEADKSNLSGDCQALGYSVCSEKKRQVRLIWDLHYLLHLAWLGMAPSLYRLTTPTKASTEGSLMGSDMAGTGLQQPGHRDPSPRAKMLATALCSATEERNGLKLSQGPWDSQEHLSSRHGEQQELGSRGWAADMDYLSGTNSSDHRHFVIWLRSHPGDRKELGEGKMDGFRHLL
jgi:hypothetical protein